MKKIVCGLCIALSLQSMTLIAETETLTIYKQGDLYYEDSDKKTLFTGIYSVYWTENKEHKKSEVHYEKGEPHGRAVSWYIDGRKKFLANVNKGHFIEKVTSWYPNGKKKAEASYDNEGNLTGRSKRWYTNGQKRMEVYLRDGLPKGLYTVWRKNGKKIGEIDYSDSDAAAPMMTKIIGIENDAKFKGLKIEYGVKSHKTSFNTKDEIK